MSNRKDVDLSYGLERVLSQSIQKVTNNITKQRALRREITRLRRQRRQLESIPDEVRQWFEETEGLEEEEEL